MEDWRIGSLQILGPGIALTGTVATVILVVLIRSIYYHAWHSLSRFRGPSAAAMSRHWIYRVSKQPRALRVGPNELHISDVSQYKVIYSQSKPFPKDVPFYEGFKIPHTVFTEVDAGKHKERRRLLNPLFPRAGVLKLEPIIHEKTEVLMKGIRHLQDTHSINIYDAFRCPTTEIIMGFAFARSANMLEESQTTFESWFLTSFDAVARSLWKMQEWPIARKALGVLPMSAVTLIDPQIANVVKMLKPWRCCLQHYANNGSTTSHPVVFDNLSSLPHDLEVTEALDILIAGADTMASTLTAGLLNILSISGIHSKLVNAMREADMGSYSHSGTQLLDLENVAFLSACVKGSLRIGMPVPGRLPRGGGADARVFNPDRWLQPEAKHLEQYLCTFSKGARMCIGQNVAYAEVTIVMVHLFRNFDIRLPSDFCPPERKDFAMKYSKPGLPLQFSSLAEK
ncbi:hypothetical protein ASPSYDRAFT_83075 [Aspergillus sydowii CBS 593.65]|uniref:Cytochrome P450 n=1 Tax=Aspergillus sydowii CBS 593.65 TaxID=1036612 RepID=A0A1L9SZD7_9EURO|nr:uncharacterized protein ASPSYDRAFT_83075 [Aspergillus sydowii CBS 593.65]OJJ52526.1 hypothetical protein ASPSYDRAFT_83075 [Aspergillus sydowii CBS 593.65]